MNNEQLQYVKDELARGATPEAVREILVSNNYTNQQAMSLIYAAQHNVAVEDIPAEPTKSDSTGFWMIVVVSFFVVIFIMGILASVVLASLNSAREKGQDASIKATVNNTRAQAELYWDENSGTYAGYCSDPIFRSGLFAELDCEDEASGYRTSAALNDGSYYCADSSGFTDLVATKPQGTSCQ